MSMKYRHECPEGCKVFVGNLDRHLNRDRIRHIFGDFGRVRDVWLATNPPGFGFVMFEHKSDAIEAVKRMNNQTLSGRAMTVELATGLKRRDSSEGDCVDHRRDRRFSYREDERRQRGRHRSGSGDRRQRMRSSCPKGYGDRVFYQSDFQRKASPLSGRRRRSDAEESSSNQRARSREGRDDKPLKDRNDDKSRSRRRFDH